MKKDHGNHPGRNLDTEKSRGLLERGGPRAGPGSRLGTDRAISGLFRATPEVEPKNEPDRPAFAAGNHHSSFPRFAAPSASPAQNRPRAGSWNWCGFPGIPLKIARPGLTIDLVEATAKKVSFLKEAVRRLGLSGVEVWPLFLGKSPVPFDSANPWEVFISRGVNLEVVLKAVEPYWSPSQRLLLMKGKDWEEEISGLAPFLKKMEIIVDRTVPIKNPLSGKDWVLLILKKSELMRL